MKILYVVEHYHPYIGGVEKLFQNLCESVVLQGHEPIVVTSKHSDDLPDKEVYKGVQIYRLPLKNRFLFTFFAWPWILKYAKGVDLVHTTSYNAALPAFNVAKFYNIKSIITFHEVWGKLWFQVPMLNNLQRLVYAIYERFILLFHFTKYVAVSDYTYNELGKYPFIRNRRTTILNGIDYSDFSSFWMPPANKKFTYTFFGRLGVSKGISIMVEGAAKFNNKHEDVHFQFVLPKYPSAMRKKVLALVKEKKLTKYTFHHELERAELDTLLLKSDCAVIPSYSEGFGYSAVECCAMGIPIISSEKGALSEVTSGKVITMKDTTAEGVNAALEMAKNNQWVQKSRKKFHLSATVKNYLKLYEEISD
jgi:glycosyltransferase involved in cell wall biosynthesis